MKILPSNSIRLEVSILTSFLNIVTLPLAVSGAFLALYIFHQDLNLYSMIGILLLLGVATKNSILDSL